jgi:hypothetical protein
MLMNKFSGADRMEAPCRKHGASPKKMALWKEAIKTSRGSRARDATSFLVFFAQGKSRPALSAGRLELQNVSYRRLPQKR